MQALSNSTLNDTLPNVHRRPIRDARLLLGMLALIFTEAAQPGARAQTLYVSDVSTDEVFRYDAGTGALIDTFVTAGAGGNVEPHGIVARCNDVLVASFGTDEILRYDRSDGTLLGVFADATSGLDDPVYMIERDGLLYVSSQASDEVLRYDADGALVDVFVAAGSGGLDGPSGMAFGPGGDLFVAGRYSADVARYEGNTGAFVEEIAGPGDGLAVGTTFGLAFAGNGDLYVASNEQVFRIDVAVPQVTAAVPVTFPIGIESGSADAVFVATAGNLRVLDSSNVFGAPVLSPGVAGLLNFFHFEAAAPCGAGAVPAVSTWGLVVMLLLIVGAASILMRRVRAPVPSPVARRP